MSKKINEKKLEFYVLSTDMHSGEPVMFNIFNNIRIRNEIIELLKKEPTKEELKKKLDSICMNQLWTRIQYEIDVKRHSSEGEWNRVDCYDQVKPNLDMLTDYLLTLI